MSQPDILTYNLHPWKMGKVCHNGITNTGSWELQWLISKRLLSNLQIFILASVVWIRAWRNISVTSSVGESSSFSGFSGLCPEFQKRSQCLKLCNQISVLIRSYRLVSVYLLPCHRSPRSTINHFSINQLVFTYLSVSGPFCDTCRLDWLNMLYLIYI